MSWDVAADVQAWVNGTATNYGWRVKDQTEDGGNLLSTFRTHESALVAERPTLEVTYTPP